MMNSRLNSVYVKLGRFLDTSLFAYCMLFLVQLRAVWGMWRCRDLTFGDTSYYFVAAHHWYDGLSVNFVWSPLYTAFYGTFLFLTKDVPFITMLHRLVIVFMATLLVFAIMRRLLPTGLAWLMSVWWAVLPINYNTLYAVHLFALIPILVAWVLVLHSSSTWARASVLAVLVTASILVRNELVVSVILFLGCCIWWEIRLLRESEGPRRKGYGSLVAKYGALQGAAILVCFFFFWRSDAGSSNIADALHAKHTLNTCQTFAFGYQQRHPEWSKDPFTHCSDLMAETFGKARPTLSEMLDANPSAVLEHFLWNVRLIPSGLQLMLFNATSSGLNPDYIPVLLNRTFPMVLGVFVCVVVVFGLLEMYRTRQWWYNHWFKERAFGLLSIAAVVSVAVPVILTQRPRPSYLFSLSVAFLVLIGTSLYAISARWPRLEALIQGRSRLFPIIMILTVITTPSLPTLYSFAGVKPSQRLLDEYRRLAPFGEIISAKQTVFLKGAYAQEIRNYIGLGKPKVLDYGVLGQLLPNERIEDFLRERRINLFYVDEELWRKLNGSPAYRDFIASPWLNGWNVVASGNGSSGPWALLQRIG